MERRTGIRIPCHLRALVLSFGCQFRGRISDFSSHGLRLQLSDGLALADRDAFVLSCETFGMVHGEVIWRHGETIGARICNWQSAAACRRIQPHIPSPLCS